MPQTVVTYLDFGGQEEALIFKWLGVVAVGGLVCCCFDDDDELMLNVLRCHLTY